MKRLVIDASVCVKWFVRGDTEGNRPAAVELLQGVGENRFEVIQPPHWLAETMSVLTRLQPGMAGRAVDLLDALEIPMQATAADYRLASRLARDLDQHLFDTLYHAVAMRRDAEFVTDDRRYFKKAAVLFLITQQLGTHHGGQRKRNKSGNQDSTSECQRELDE